MATIGGARFIIVLRDPATRFWAHLWQRQQIKGRAREDLIEAVRTLSMDPEQIKNWPATDYAHTIAALEKAVDPRRIHYLFHEFLDKRGALDPLFAFLGVPPTPEHRIPQFEDEALPEMPPKLYTKLRKLLVPQYKAVRARFGEENLPPEWADRPVSIAKRVDPTAYPPASPHIAAPHTSGATPVGESGPHADVPPDASLNRNAETSLGEQAVTGDTPHAASAKKKRKSRSAAARRRAAADQPAIKSGRPTEE
jgi:hypothetical protein